MTVYQAVASFVPSDAVGEAARRFRDLIEPGVRAPRVIGDLINGHLAKEAIPFGEFGRGSSTDVIIYHAATASPLAEWLVGRPERVVVYYHNVTPAEFMRPFDPSEADRQELARAEISELSEVAEAGAAPSAFSVDELDAWGYRDTRVVRYPVALRATKAGVVSKSRIPRDAQDDFDDGEVLFVGRLTPNKCQHELLRAFAALRQLRPAARLRLVGPTHLPLYELYLRRLADSLGIEQDAITGGVSDQALVAHYACARVFCSLSRHEGFGVPLVEAMSNGLPVVALAEAAVAETVGDGGILLPEDRPALVAAVLDRVCSDRELRFELAEAGVERARELSDPGRTRAAVLELVAA